MMQRRGLIKLLGGAAAAWPLAARAQQASKLPTIGYFGGSTLSAQQQWTAAFVDRMRELGWIEGRTVAIEYRWAEGRTERYAEIAAELVKSKVSVIVVNATAPTLAARRATSEIPIVFASAADPVGTGIVASLSRPGANVTGLSLQTTDLSAKRVELMHEVVPRLHRLAILANTGSPNTVLEIAEVQTAAKAYGLETVTSEIRRDEDIPAAFAALKGHVDAVYVATDPVTQTNRLRISILAAGAQLPTIFGFREFVDAGGLMSYGASFSQIFRRAADLVDMVLRGRSPADIPVEQPTKFELVINLTAAKALGITVPPTLLAIADEVIE
jgi:putative ABC transport system substrate-binding protein